MNYKNNKNKMIYLILISFILFSILHVVNVKAATCVDVCPSGYIAGCTADPDPCDIFPFCSCTFEECHYDCMFIGQGFCSGDDYCYCWKEMSCKFCDPKICPKCPSQPCGCACKQQGYDNAGLTTNSNPCDGFPYCAGSYDECRYNCKNLGTGYDTQGRYCYCWDEKSCDCRKGCCSGVCDNSGGCIHEPKDYYCNPGWVCNSDCECEESITPTTPVTTPTTSPTCTDECSPSGSKRCRGDRIQQCKDCDADSCLEWCTIKDCGDMGSDYTCQNNKCVDAVPPTTSIKCNDQTCRDDCWYNKVVAVSFSCSDGGSGCDETTYCHDYSDSCTPDKIYSFPFNMPNGINYLRYFSEDNDGNKEATKSQELKIDTGLVDETIVSFVSVKNLGAERKPIQLSHSFSPYTDKIKIDFYPNPIVPPDKNAKMTITVEYGTPVGEYTITIKGTADGIERTTTYKLDVTLTNPFIFPPPTTTTTTSTTTTAASTTSTTSTKTTIPPPPDTGQGLAVVPGSIYKEYILNIAELPDKDDWRVTSPEATANGSQQHLPNPIMQINIGDLNGAVKAEMLINRWGGHSGTSGKKIRFNNKPWIYLPELRTTPTTPQNYMYQDNPVIEIPLSHLNEGINKLEGSAEGTGWPQWGWMSVIVRIYYDSDKPHPTGQITSPLSGKNLGENPSITAQAQSAVGIEKVDFLAYYEGYDENGDGYYKDWHHGYFNLRSGDTAVKISGHVGYDSSSPYQVTWDTKYVPDQAAGSVKLLARIKDNNGVWYVTSYVDGLSLQRSDSSVRLYKSYNVPENYCIRDDNKKSNKIKITDSLSKAESATIHMRTWNGQDSFHEGNNKINGVNFQIGGRNHDYKYSVINIPLSAPVYGDNTVEFYSTTEHHCLEVLWPGPGIVVRYTEPITTTTSTTTTSTTTTSTKTTIPSLTFKHVIVDSEIYGGKSIGDIDGDGFNDIIVGIDSTGSKGLVWYKYPNWNRYSIKSFNWRLSDNPAIADIDRDEDIDVVGAQDEDGKVYWFKNPRPSGDPKKEWTNYSIGKNNAFVKDIETADFNRDGKPDVVTRTQTTTSIFIQNTPTSWNKVKTITHHDNEGMDVGDLDKDGDPDIVLNGFWLENPYPNMAGSWNEHNIDSKWWDQNNGRWQDNNCVVEVADVNNDGLFDVLISHSEFYNYPVSWYELSNPSNPKGSWTEHKIKNIFDYAQTLQAGDMDNDGDIDVVVGQFERDTGEVPPPYPLKVYYNKGGDGLSWNEIQIDDLGIYHGVLGDIGNDGDLDIVGARSYYKPPIELWENLRSDNKLSLNRWTYIQVDNNMPYRIDRTSGPGYFFGVAIGDLTGDGYKDIVAHKMFYKNPGGNMQGTWQRIAFSTSWNWIDAFAIVNVDGDQYGDVIAEGEESNNNINIYWLEALNNAGTSWKRVLIGTVPETSHFWSQVYDVAQIIPGGKPEILIGGGDGVYYFKIPSNPASGNWPRVKIIDNGYGYATGDINGDGFLDVAGAYDSVNVAWWKNPGTGAGSWPRYTIGQIIYKTADRFAIVDIDRDGRKDIVVSEEVYPVTSGSRIFWFKAKPDPQSGGWTRNTVVSNACSLNSMSVADMDRDGDMDIVSGEMGNPSCEVQKRMMISANDGKGNFASPIVVDTDKESHLGARAADLDNDGDLEIISIGWNEYQYLHLWRNDAIS